jgi:hypothetical protein
MPAAFDTDYVKKLDGPNKKEAATKRELAEALRDDIRRFKEENRCDRMVMVWCGSTEIFLRPGRVHETMDGPYVEGLLVVELAADGAEERAEYNCYLDKAGKLFRLNRRSP